MHIALNLKWDHLWAKKCHENRLNIFRDMRVAINSTQADKPTDRQTDPGTKPKLFPCLQCIK